MSIKSWNYFLLFTNKLVIFNQFNMINQNKLLVGILIGLFVVFADGNQVIDPSKTIVWGPGLKPDKVVLPARYFYIHAVDRNGLRLSKSLGHPYLVTIEAGPGQNRCIHTINQVDRGDGSVIVRYKLIQMCMDIKINVKYNGSHIGSSPYEVKGISLSENCDCPKDLLPWMMDNECPKHENRINMDLHMFKKVNFSGIRESLLRKYNMPGSVSLCNYIVKNNEIYRNCYGKYTGFKMFMDATLLSLTRIVKLPDFEFFLNLGDWPLAKKGGHSRTTGPYPIFSWCGSDDTFDIVLPTYDITESTLENMGRVTLDMLSVQKQTYKWDEKEEKGFFRGRDSRRERLNLVDLARKYPDLLNASITNFFFFRDEEDKYGPKVAHISFLEFFKYKYQINIDGTVASYRFPYLLGGSSLVFKQESPFYEHFYDKIVPNRHYIPFKRDLSDLVDKIKWAKENDDKAKEIVENSRQFIHENLLPLNIYCYHVLLFKEWSERIVSPIVVLPGMEKVEQDTKCNCQSKEKLLNKDEL